MSRLSSSELIELEKFIAKVSSEGFSYALRFSCPNLNQYPFFSPLKNLKNEEAIEWLENLMKDHNLNYN